LLAEAHAAVPVLVLALVHALVGLVVDALLAQRVQQLVGRAQAVLAPVAEQHRRAAAAEERVLQQHAALVAQVQVLREVLRADHHGQGVGPTAQQLLREVDGLI